jgi:hypothetical protein
LPGSPYLDNADEIQRRIAAARAWDDDWDGYRNLPRAPAEGVTYHAFPDRPDVMNDIARNGIQSGVARGEAPGPNASTIWFSNDMPFYAGAPAFAFESDRLRAMGADLDASGLAGQSGVGRITHDLAPNGVPVADAALVYHTTGGYVIPIHVPEGFRGDLPMPPGYVPPDAPLPGGRDMRPGARAGGVDGTHPDGGPEGRPTAAEGGTARTTSGDAGGGTGAGDCATCSAGGGSRAGQGGTLGDAGVQAAPPAPPAPPPGARSAPGAPPPPADGADAFARAQRVGGSTQDGVVYAVGGTGDDHQIYRYTPDGQYLGPADRVPRGATELGVTSQIQDLQNPGAPTSRFLTAPDGQRYAIGPEGMAEVRQDGSLRTLSPSERAALPRTVQSQALLRAAGPTLAMPDGINGGMWRQLGTEMVGNWADGAEINRDVERARQGGPPTAGPAPRR